MVNNCGEQFMVKGIGSLRILFVVIIILAAIAANVDSKTKCNVLVFKSSRFKEESVNFASWIKEEASSAEEQLDQAIDSCTTLK